MSKKRTWIQKASYGMCLGTLLFSPAESWLEDQHSIEAVTQAEIEMSFQERFPDPNLAYAVYLELYPEKTLFPERVNLEAPVSAEQLATITTLADTVERPIADLTGIQQLSHLKTLHAEGNEGGADSTASTIGIDEKLRVFDLAKRIHPRPNPLSQAHAVTELGSFL
ncbi:hypothetical protein HCA60_11755 [Listeria booriae]|nr:hypothetical protein [Listeria booriae]MBC1813163.1 hypothetical protein [Listeria booriae]